MSKKEQFIKLTTELMDLWEMYLMKEIEEEEFIAWESELRSEICRIQREL